MKPATTQALVCLLLLAGCASAKVQNRQNASGASLDAVGTFYLAYPQVHEATGDNVEFAGAKTIETLALESGSVRRELRWAASHRHRTLPSRRLATPT